MNRRAFLRFLSIAAAVAPVASTWRPLTPAAPVVPADFISYAGWVKDVGRWKHVAMVHAVDGSLIRTYVGGRPHPLDALDVFDPNVPVRLAKVAEWARWDRGLSIQEIGNLAGGRYPETLTERLVWHARYM